MSLKVQTPARIDKVQTMSDRGYRLYVTTPELLPQEGAVLLALTRREGWLFFSENEFTESDIPTKDAPKLKDGRSQSELLRAVMFRIWEIDNHGYDDFNRFYQSEMGELIGSYKTRLREYDNANI